MSGRKPIGKKLRFEVFKRDAFTCQYCGQKAPDVILHVDHISPVAKGGDNDILNLVTSCQPCNSGKGMRTLSDNSELEKQRAQLEELSERREQLEAMLEWRDELRGFDDSVLGAVSEVWCEAVYPFTLTDTGASDLRKLVKKFGYDVAIQAIDKSTSQYLCFGDEGPTPESVEAAFSKLGGICYFIANPDRAADDRDIFYIRGILRNRLSYVNESLCVRLLREAKGLRADMETIKQFAKEVGNWSDFRAEVEYYIKERTDG